MDKIKKHERYNVKRIPEGVYIIIDNEIGYKPGNIYNFYTMKHVAQMIADDLNFHDKKAKENV